VALPLEKHYANFMEARKGWVADFSVRRLTLWLRSQANGTRRAPAPSRLAQRDVAKTCYSGKCVPESNSKRIVQSPWRRACCRTTLLGGRAPIAQGWPIGGNQLRNNYHYIVLDQR